MLLETALKDYLSLPCRVPPAHIRCRVARPCIQRSTARLNFPKGAPCAWGIQSVWLCQLPDTRWAPLATTAPLTPSFLLFWPNFYQKPGWNDITEGWSENTCGPSISLLDFTSDSSQTRKLVHTVIILYQFTWNGFAICFQWAKFKFLSPSLPMSKIQVLSPSLSLCVYKCVCVSIYILQINIYIYLEYITLIDGGP